MLYSLDVRAKGIEREALEIIGPTAEVIVVAVMKNTNYTKTQNLIRMGE